MKKTAMFAMFVIGAGMVMLGASGYGPEYGWSDDCRWCMTGGAMLMAGGWRLP